MTFGSLFAGIGGFDLGLERAGMTCKWQVEIDPYCRAVLAKHWPEVYRHDDIRTFPDQRGTEPRGVGVRSHKEVERHIDLICGGFPCQPFSVAGKRRGHQDDRYLWPEMLRVITTLRPAWVIGENVPGIIGMGLDTALSDLEAAGYACQTFDIPAVAVDASHLRHRIWIVAYSGINRLQPGDWRGSLRDFNRDDTGEVAGRAIEQSRPCNGGDVADPVSGRQPRPGQPVHAVDSAPAEHRQAAEPVDGRGPYLWLPKPRLGGVVDGLSAWLDEPPDIPRVTKEAKGRVRRLRALGNAVVPQIVERLGRMIMAVESRTGDGFAVVEAR